MAMRQGSGGVSATLPRQSASPVYEDFQPRLEQKEEPAASVILVHLPGFVKERIKITYVQSSSILRVNGERPLKDNKWSRFNQAFPIPENSDVDKIQAKFQQGILTITMPKKIIAQVRPAEEPKTIQKATTTTESSAEPKPKEVAEEISPPKPPSAQTIAQKAASPQWKSTAERKPQKVLEEIPPPIPPPRTSAKTILEGIVEDNIPSKATSTAIDERQKEESSAPKARKVEDVTAPKAASTTDTLIKESEKFTERTVAKGKESVQKIAESVLMAKTAAAKILDKEKEKKQRNADDFNAEKETGLKNTMESAKQKVKNLGSKRLNEEEKQSLINVGAAVLVVVALGVGVYISYRYNSSGKAEK